MLKYCAWAVFALIAGCGDTRSARSASDRPQSEIEPDDFALQACPHVEAGRDCIFVLAGGKRILFGAPDRALDHLAPDDKANLDAVLIFQMRSEDLEGLDDIRNQTWRAGRLDPLRVAGPNELKDFVIGLNTIYAKADANSFITRKPPGGFDAALLQGAIGPKGAAWKAFDTGDLKIEAYPANADTLVYRVLYGGVSLTLVGCGGEAHEGALSCGTNGVWLDGDAVRFVIER